MIVLTAGVYAEGTTELAQEEGRIDPVVIRIESGADLEAAARRVRLRLSQHPGADVPGADIPSADMPSADIIVELEQGTYSLAAPLVLDARDGGGTSRQVTWRAVPGETVTFSGANAATPWREDEDGSWSAPASGPLVRQLFMGGERRHRARWPREGWLRLEKEGPDRRTSFRFRSGDLAPWERRPAAGLAGSELLLLHDWSMSRVGVASIDGESRWLTATDTIGGYLPFFFLTNFEPHPRYALENVAPGWSQPGDWWHDVGAGRLRYLPMPREQLGEARPTVPALQTLVEIRGTEEAPVRGLAFEGITFAHTRAMSPTGGYAGIQAAFHDQRADAQPHPERPSPAAVHVRFARGVRFANCQFRALGASALWLAEGVQGAQVQRCHFEDVGANGLMIGTPKEPGEADVEGLLTRSVTCADSTMERCGAVYMGAVGIWIGIARDVHVHHNELRRLPYTGISLGWIWSPRPSPSAGHVIEHNHIHHVMQRLSDGGGIYTIGRHPDSHLRHNLIHDVPINLGRAGSNGFFIDQGSSELTISENVVHSIARSPVRFHMAGPCTLEGNTLVSAESVATFRYDSCDPQTMSLVNNQHLTSPPWRPSKTPPLEVGPRPPAGQGRARPDRQAAPTPHRR